jgi:hypothetical protein
LFKNDVEFNQQVANSPFHVSAIPVPKYDLVGDKNFKGVGIYSHSGDDRFEIDGKTVLFNSFCVKKNPVNETNIGTLAIVVFFHLIF